MVVPSVVLVLILVLFCGVLLRHRFKHGLTAPATRPFVPAKELKTPTPIDSYAVRLAMTASWVNRRVERFDFVDATTVRRQMSVDFTLPDAGFADGDGSGSEPTVLVPLMLLKKGVLRDLDVTDADDRSVNVVESETSATITIAGLQDLIEKVTRVEPSEKALRELESVVRKRPKDARPSATLALGPNGAVGRLLAGVPTPADEDGAKDQEELIDTVRALVGELAAGFLLLVAVPYRPGVPTLVKFAYDTRIQTFWQYREERGSGAAARLFLNRLLSSLGLVGRVEYFPELGVRRGRSYHAEIVPAGGTYCEEANLCVHRAAHGNDEPSDEPQVDDLPTQGVYRDFHHSRPHLWVGGGGEETDRDEQGLVEVVVYAARDALILPLLFSAALIAGVLSLVPAHHTDVDGITLGALLLAPVLLAAYYARSDENGYVTMSMRLVRYVAMVSVVAAITVIAQIALGYVQVPDGNGRTVDLGGAFALGVLRWAARVSLGCAVVLAMAFLAPMINERSRWLWLGVNSAPLPRGEKAGQPDMRVMLFPPFVLIVLGALAMGWLLRLLPV